MDKTKSDAADTDLARRVEQLKMWWPQDRPMPTAFILSGIVGGTPEQVEAQLERLRLAAGTEERS